MSRFLPAVLACVLLSAAARDQAAEGLLERLRQWHARAAAELTKQSDGLDDHA